MPPTIRYRLGLPDALRLEGARLFDQAFGAKLALAVPDAEARVAMIEAALQPGFALVALDGDSLVGMAGFHTPQGALTGGLSARGLRRRFGLWRGLRAIAVLALYERTPRPGEMVMDGIVVRESHRGLGIGTELLERLSRRAAELGFERLRLDVIDTNAAARRLYEQRGFIPVATERFEILRRVLGFGAATTLVRDLTA